MSSSAMIHIPTELYAGDVNYPRQFSLTHKIFGEDYKTVYRAPKGESYVVMLLGKVPTGQRLNRESLIEMMDKLGWVPKE